MTACLGSKDVVSESTTGPLDPSIKKVDLCVFFQMTWRSNLHCDTVHPWPTKASRIDSTPDARLALAFFQPRIAELSGATRIALGEAAQRVDEASLSGRLDGMAPIQTWGLILR